MNDLILILGRSLGEISKYKNNKLKIFFRIHFIGHYKGIKIKEVHVYSSQELEIHKGGDYLIWGNLTSVNLGVLEVQLKKHKRVDVDK